MKIFKYFLGSVALVAIVMSSANVTAATFVIDPAYSNIIFKIDHLNGYNIGAFRSFGGYITLNDTNDQIDSVMASVDVTSIYTKSLERDALLRSELFFDTDKFPEAKLVGKTIKDKKLICDLTIKGKTREVIFDLKFGAIGKDPKGMVKFSLFANGSFNRNDFGIKFNQKLPGKKKLLGEDVEIKLEWEATLVGA